MFRFVNTRTPAGGGGGGGVEAENNGAPIAGGPFTTLDLAPGLTGSDSGGGVLEITPDAPGIDAENAGVPIAGGPFTVIDLAPGLTGADAGGGVLEITPDAPPAPGIEAENDGAPIAGGPFTTVNLAPGLTGADAGGGVLEITPDATAVVPTVMNEVARAIAPADGSGITDYWQNGLGAWTWTQQESVTAALNNGVLKLTNAGAATTASLKALARNIPTPTGAWIFRIALGSADFPATNNVACGLWLHETATGKNVRYMLMYSTSGTAHRIECFLYSALNTFGSAPLTPRNLQNLQNLRAVYELEIRHVSTNIEFWYRDSPGGVWTQLGTVADATAFTTRADQAGICFIIPTGATITAAYGAFLQVA